MCLRIAVVCIALLIQLQLSSAAATTQITRKQWVTDRILKIQDDFQADNVFSYALCREDKRWGYVDLSCRVIVERFSKHNEVQTHECHSNFNKSLDSLLHIRFASHDKVVLTSLQRTNGADQLAHVIRIIDLATCKSHDIKVTLNRELLEMSSVQGTKVFMKADDVFEIIYDAPGQLCDTDICKMTFSAKGKVLSDFQPLSRQALPITDGDVLIGEPYSIIFKYLYPLAVANEETQYFIVTLQTSGDLPLPYVSDRPVLISLLKANSEGCEVLETLKFDCFGFDRQNFIDIDESLGFLSVCFKDYKSFGPTMMRCRQYDKHWRKTLDVDRVINNNDVNAIKVKSWKEGELLLATHETEATRNEQRVYVRKIETGGRRETPVFISEVSASQFDPWSIDYLTNFYENDGSSLCLMGWYLSHLRNYFQHCEITRMCFSKQALNQ